MTTPGDTGANFRADPGPAFPSIKRRLASMVYESLLVFGIAFFAGLVFYGVTHAGMAGWMRHLFQAYLFLVIGLYFVWCWHQSGQTLAMKTWKLRLIRADGGRVSVPRGVVRYIYAWLSVGLAGSGIFYALFDRERQFLHDRMAGTKVVMGGEKSQKP